MINGCNTYFEEHGTGENTVIFLHDLFFNNRMFNQQMIALRDRYRCVLLDLRGHGASKVSSGGYSSRAQADDIGQFIDVQRYGSCHLIGCGLGGNAALQTALYHLDAVRSLTLINTTLDDVPELDARFLKSKALQLKLFGPRFVSKSLLKRSFSSKFLQTSSNREQIKNLKRDFLKMDRRSIAQALPLRLLTQFERKTSPATCVR